jgi:uncharacterized damage-inducible protein DinB
LKKKFNPHKPPKIPPPKLTEMEELEKNMTPEVARIAAQLQATFEGPAWHGDAVMEILENVTWEEAMARPLSKTHSIAELVLHLTAWESVVFRRLRGEAVELEDAENWPNAAIQTEDKWQQMVAALAEGHAKLYEAVLHLDDTRLSDPVRGCDYDIYFMLHGVIHHDLYHSGQIALLKKAVS